MQTQIYENKPVTQNENRGRKIILIDEIRSIITVAHPNNRFSFSNNY